MYAKISPRLMGSAITLSSNVSIQNNLDLIKEPSLSNQRSSIYPSPNVRIGGQRFNLLTQIGKSSVNYFILSYLPPLQILRLGQLNRRYYDLYVPVTLSNVTLSGTVPCTNTK